MKSVYKVKLLFSALAVALLAATPMVRAQDAAASSAPSASSPGNAEDPATPPPDNAAPMPKKGKKGGMMDPISQVSGLTDDQKAQIKTIREATRSKIEALPDDDSKRDASRQIMMDAAKQVRALLTDDQKTQYDAAMKKSMRRKKKSDDGDMGPPPPPADAPAAPSSSM